MADSRGNQIQTLRSRSRDAMKVIDAMNKSGFAFQGKDRRSLRVPYNVGPVRAVVRPSTGGEVVFEVYPRNISSSGVAFIHGQFVYVGSEVQIDLPMMDASEVRQTGRIVGCRHVCDVIHEVSVAFTQPLNLVDFVNLPDEVADKCAEEWENACFEAGKKARKPPRLQGVCLIADDLDSNLRLLSLLIQRAGMDVVQAKDSKKILDAVRQMHVDAILLDIRLGKEDGHEVARAIRGAGYAGPILALSAHEDEKTQASIIKAGANGFLAKPCDPETLYETLQGLLLENAQTKAPIHSRLKHDPEAKPLLRTFVDELSGRADALTQSLNQSDVETMLAICREVKGSGGSLGYDALVRIADKACKRIQEADDDIKAITESVRKVIDAIHRTQA